MTSISIREARRRLSDLIDAAEHGQITAITRRGKVVACLAPADKKQPPIPDMSQFRKSLKIKGRSLSRQVVESRSQERF